MVSAPSTWNMGSAVLERVRALPSSVTVTVLPAGMLMVASSARSDVIVTVPPSGASSICFWSVAAADALAALPEAASASAAAARPTPPSMHTLSATSTPMT